MMIVIRLQKVPPRALPQVTAVVAVRVAGLFLRIAHGFRRSCVCFNGPALLFLVISVFICATAPVYFVIYMSGNATADQSRSS